jgi:hypothetical protein
MAEDKANARQVRLAAALKENLKRRKAQARAKAKPDEGIAPPAGLGAEPPCPGPKSAPKRD